MYNFIKTIVEGKIPKKLERIKLPYSLNDLDPVKSKQTLEYHYGELYKGYVERYNNGEGDMDFNEAGAFLHARYFSQFVEPKNNNTPNTACLNFIQQHYKDFDDFKIKFSKIAMTIQGSGWIYLSRDGKIKTIVNHEIRQDIVLLVDWWEHAWALDYQSNKSKYLDNIWKIIDWTVIEQRI
jgi:Fe-Mn family superoxide dismutase